MTKYPSQLQDKFNLRLPDGMRDAIAERAKANGRSMNSEIVDMINNALYLPSIGDDAIEYMLELANSDNMANLTTNDKANVESLLMQLVEKLTHKIERESASLRQVVGVIQTLKDVPPDC